MEGVCFRRHFQSSCLDAVAGYLVDLQARGNHNARDIAQGFRELQKRLEMLNLS